MKSKGLKLSCVLVLVLLSCSNKKNTLLGTWQVSSTFYKATYQIIEDNGAIKAKVLYYDDDTTIYNYQEKQSYYLFKDLKEKQNRYVDATSGATDTKTRRGISIKIIHMDSLAVTSYVMGKPLTEIWIRSKNQ
ncbi:hypothetical protein [Aquimarina sp. 2201CG5-10]|uniref:hypothetical protein n=1 Tax=Aquimarina callyspongiae TaxID=3098150 RepID=UPI002AB3E4F1|nr:hypothetical protein [Aquimarina sp. 2201CG5-10]MDY8137987.1 hypothetical protein [Aquimarina sp. 2201CG5-10]